MSYKNLTHKQIFSGEVVYTLDDFTRDFRKRLKEDWGSESIDKNRGNKTIYQAMLLVVVFASQSKSLKQINEILAGKDTKELRETLSEFLGMFEQEIKVLEGLQMKMFLDNLQTFRMSDSLNLKLLNANFQTWLGRALESKD